MPLLILLAASTTNREIELPSIDGSTTLTGPAAVQLGPIATDQEILLPSIDGSSELIGPSLFKVRPVPPPAPGPPPPLPPLAPYDPGSPYPPELFVPQLTAELRSPDGTYLSVLITQQATQFDSGLNETGAGSLQLQLDDPDADLVIPGLEIWNRLDGDLVFIWMIEQPPEVVTLTEGEEAAEVLSISGRGIAGLLGRTITFPMFPKYPNPLESSAPTNPQHRLYTFASYDYPRDRVLAWPRAVEQGSGPVGTQRFRTSPLEVITDRGSEADFIEFVRVPAPHEFPIPNAFWIWGNDDPTAQIGYNYFRTGFILTETKQVKIACSGDNFYTLYLDGTPLLGESENRGCWQEWREVNMTLPPGLYILAMVVQNAPLAAFEFSPPPPDLFNPGGCVFGVVELDDKSEIIPDIPYIISSSAITRCLAYPAQEPGFTPGEIIGGMIVEAQMRDHLLGFAVGFTDTHDSNGLPWDFEPLFSVRAGATILEALDGLVQDGIVDWRVNPGNRTLEMYRYNTLGQIATVTYEQTGDIETQNLVELQFDPEGIVYNRWLVRWTKGYFTLWDDDSRADLGYWVEGMMSVDAETRPEAVKKGRFLMAEQLDTSYATVAELDPLGPDDRPFVAFDVGDSVLAPDRFGDERTQRVHAISVRVNELGRPLFSLELNKRQGSQARDERKLIQSIGRALQGDTEFRNTKLAATDGIG